MKTLLVMRHAKSGHDNPALSDHDRILTRRGERDAHAMGEFLAANSPPDLIVSSSAVRARRTAEIVAAACSQTGEVQIEPRLYDASAADWQAVVRGLPETAGCVLCVGHNPGIEQFLSRGGAASMQTSCIARVRMRAESWQALGATMPLTIDAVWRPKEIDAA